MTKMLFTHSYFYRYDKKQWRIAQPYPPLMTITAAAVMRESGYEVALFDVGLRDGYGELPALLESYQPHFFVVFDDGFNYLTKMCLTKMREAAFEMQKLAKSTGAKVITCSSDSTDHYKKYLVQGADIVIRGEGEITLKELITSLKKDKDIRNVAGIAYYDNEGKIKVTQRRSIIKQLDNLPRAAWDLVDVEAYRNIWLKKHDQFYLNVATTRGCPYKCNWCAKPIYGNRYNVRTPEKIIDEIRFLHELYGVSYFWMCDDIFGLKPGWVQNFDKALKKSLLKIKYKIQSRVDLMLEENNIDALISSGLDEVWIGAESGSQKILDAMDKGTKVTQIYEATRILKKKGVKVSFFIQFGYLNETQEDIDKTIRMVLELMPHNLGVSVSYPLPGTKFFEKTKSDLKQKTNWIDSDDLDIMYQNTFPSAYYKVLHRFLHTRYAIKKSKIEFSTIFYKIYMPKWYKAIIKLLYYCIKRFYLSYKLSKIAALTLISLIFITNSRINFCHFFSNFYL